MTAASLGRPPRPDGKPPLAGDSQRTSSQARMLAKTLGERRPTVTGWLLKQKRTGRFFRGTNKRYFTVDFEGSIFYYAHSASQKQVSRPIPFRDIVTVENFVRGSAAEAEPMIYCAPPSDDEAERPAGDEDWDGKDTSDEDEPDPIPRSTSKPSMTSKSSSFSLSSRLRSGLSAFRKGGEQHGVKVMMRAGSHEECLELLAPSKEDADRWFQAFSAAMEAGRAGLASTTKSAVGGDVAATAEDSTEDGSTHGDRAVSGGGSPPGARVGKASHGGYSCAGPQAAEQPTEGGYDSDSS
eukprot:TRINITY_DN13554_c0_g1_i1.p1 TRINITY_DN13554_c0_g1~~TRINITY_DN13554_c0_g1_i1.p1  ORF type:complete len:326 (+),score=26.37 TRINITY_DN13554_c0_g1_i1:91-978(+)